MAPDDSVDDPARGGGSPKTADERDLDFLRSTSPTFKALVRNMICTYSRQDTEVRSAGGDDSEPEAFDGVVPCLTVKRGDDLLVIEIATGAMLRNAHLIERLTTLAKIERARRWLVVPFDDLIEAQLLIKNLPGGWRAIVGDG